MTDCGVLVWWHLLLLGLGQLSGYCAAQFVLRRASQLELDARLTPQSERSQRDRAKFPGSWTGAIERLIFFALAAWLNVAAQDLVGLAIAWIVAKVAANWGPMIGIGGTPDEAKARGSRAFLAFMAGVFSVGIAVVTGLAAHWISNHLL